MINPKSLLQLSKRAATLVSALPQSSTNGDSNLGTLDAPQLPEYLTNNPLPNGFPWSTDTVENTNPYTNPPVTGVTRKYDFTISEKTIAPDGYEKVALVVNDAFPAPIIEANWGDTIEVTVHNKLPTEGTSLHWHGILQKKTPYYDGVPSVQQCPIAPNKTFTYRFQADLYGSSWYHSHYSAQYAAGLFGPMVIHGPKHVPYDKDVGPVLLTDYYHGDYLELVAQAIGDQATAAFKSDNNLINGKGNFSCASVTDGHKCTNNAGLSKFNFQSGKKHRLRLINASGEAIQRFSIDNHTLTVIANDFVPVKPYDTDVVTLGVGQRTDVVVEATGKPGDSYWMRSNISALCSLPNKPEALAVIHYENADPNAAPTSLPHPYTEANCTGDALSTTEPFFTIPGPITPAVTQNVTITAHTNSSGNFLWYINDSSFRANYNHPLLLLAKMGNTSYPDDPQWNVYNFGENSSIRFNIYNPSPAAHPMHMHGHNFFVVDVGDGQWDGKTLNRIDNPQRRDVQLVESNGHIVIEINTDNPGVWPLHCHIAWHVSGGLYLNIMERPKDISEMEIPSIMAQTCRDWSAYTNTSIPDQIDSGL